MLPTVEPIYFLYGKIVHKIIEVFTKSKGLQNINEITKGVLGGNILLEEAVGDTPGKKVTEPLPTDYANKLPIHLTNFMKLIKVIGLDGEPEWKFDHDLDPPNSRLLTGVIDYHVKKPDSCLIVDYKTTKKNSSFRKTKTTIGSDLQLQCYARVAQKNFGYKANQITCALYFLDGPEFIPVQFSQETLDSVEKKLLAVYKEIENSDPDKVQGNVGNHCQRCDYLTICPFYRTGMLY